MEKPKIFFSYSRDDSEFVLNLAKELREKGANVWLDQLDIKPGTRWDKSIEDALDASQTVLVILSKTSVESNNVMDEVSYALEEGKMVLPVMLEACDVPFRLRRLQFADFSVSREKGIETLTKALGLTNEIPAKSQPVVMTPKKPIEEPQKEIEILKKSSVSSPRDDSREPVPSKSITPVKSKLPFYILGGIVVLLGILFAAGVFNSDKSEKKEPTEKTSVELSGNEKQPDIETIRKEMESISERIKFTPDGERLDDVEKELNELVTLLKKYPNSKLTIECHVHDQGNRLKNATLSKARAAVLKKMVESRGIAANRIDSQGFGESKPIASNNTREGRAANTRVEMSLSKN
ncbi:MAG: TIR domain-containing protein [Bacteroidota bacterium]